MSGTHVRLLFPEKDLESEKKSFGSYFKLVKAWKSTLREIDPTTSDIVVSGTLSEYTRRPLTFQPRDLFTTRDYEVRLTAHVTAVERSSGKILFDRDVIGRTPIRSAADLNGAERQAAPLLADDLSRNILSLLVDGAW